MKRIKKHHGTRCSKSRDSFKLLSENGESFETIEYLKTPLNGQDIAELLGMLNIPAKALIRKGEQDFKDHFKGKELSESEWIEAMVKYPKLIERPIVVKGNRAVIGRPIENVVDLINS